MANSDTGGLTEQQFRELLSPGYEPYGVEFKGPGYRSDRQFLVQVARAVLGMANRRDGGLVIIGVDDGGNAVGLAADQRATWDYDDVAASLAEYADPYVSFALQPLAYEGRDFVILHVAEFDEIPVLCRRDYTGVLRKGACYVRTRRMPETSEIPSQTEMRELLELAVDKGVRKFIERARATGLLTSGPVPPTNQERFDEQLEDLR